MGNEFNLSDTPASRYTDQGGNARDAPQATQRKDPHP